MEHLTATEKRLLELDPVWQALQDDPAGIAGVHLELDEAAPGLPPGLRELGGLKVLCHIVTESADEEALPSSVATYWRTRLTWQEVEEMVSSSLRGVGWHVDALGLPTHPRTPGLTLASGEAAYTRPGETLLLEYRPGALGKGGAVVAMRQLPTPLFDPLLDPDVFALRAEADQSLSAWQKRPPFPVLSPPPRADTLGLGVPPGSALTLRGVSAPEASEHYGAQLRGAGWARQADLVLASARLSVWRTGTGGLASLCVTPGLAGEVNVTLLLLGAEEEARSVNLWELFPGPKGPLP